VRRQLLTVPTRRTRWAGAVAVLALVCGPASAATAATAAPVPVVDCVISNDPDGTFRAVFGYVNSGPAVTVPVGASNDLDPDSLQGSQTTTFLSGTHPGSFVAPAVSKKYRVTWTVAGSSASAGWKQKECGGNVTLPTEGNGIGPIVVIVLSMAFSFGIAWVRTARAKRRAA
jgi:hypothetical protein